MFIYEPFWVGLLVLSGAVSLAYEVWTIKGLRDRKAAPGFIYSLQVVGLGVLGAILIAKAILE